MCPPPHTHTPPPPPPGEVMAFNVLEVRPDTELGKLSAAISSRVQLEAHTVLECYGSVAAATALWVRQKRQT